MQKQFNIAPFHTDIISISSEVTLLYPTLRSQCLEETKNTIVEDLMS